MKKWKLKWTKMRPLNKEEVKKISNNLPGVYRFSYEEEGDHNRYVFYVDQSQ
ncbi:unnamed protein product [marine sediment metagenome]|uniref:Uncharacterized protein n=1 Tax=marine sediment metagenome TaxID=412755 RepID=X1PBW0_9ZZZZ